MHDNSKKLKNQLVFIEICAGSARLSATFRHFKAKVHPIDSNRNRHKPFVTVFDFDLTQKGAWTMLKELIDEIYPDYIHFAPPCGTSSAARERPLPQHLIAQGVPCPKPLRSIEFPQGIPGLSPMDQLKVDKANLIYELVVKLIYYTHERGICLSIENPPRSHFWNFPGLAQASFDTDLVDYEFHGCMLGGTRKRVCRWRATPGLLDGLDIYCDDTHEHAPWQVQSTGNGWSFSTAEEAAYPQLLCDRIYQLVSSFLNYTHTDVSGEALSDHLMSSLQTGKQTRSHPSLLSEFSNIEVFPIKQLPDNAKVLRDYQRGSDPRNMEQTDTVVAGIYRTPEQFVDEALKTIHPMDSMDSVHTSIKEAVSFLVSNDAETVSKYRLHQLKTAINMARELEHEENELHSKLDPYVNKIVKSKKILLLRKLLDMTSYPDSEKLCDEIAHGFDLVGAAKKSHALPKRYKPASISVDELKSTSVWNRRCVLSKAKLTGDGSLDEQLWAETLGEVEKDWLRGPMSESQITESLGSESWICIRRFALQQSEKVRIIDDCREPKMNTALSTPEKLELMGVDHLINAALDIASKQACQNEGQRRAVLGRTLDLTAAYKNLACSPLTRWASILLVLEPLTAEPRFFISDALMFGSTASVYAFNRCARALWHLAVVWLKLITTQFYDDFPSLEFSQSSKGAQLCFEAFLQLLGWETSSNPKKSLPFSEVFKMLGVQVDLSQMTQGKVLVCNTEQRRTSILSQIEAIRSEGFLDRPTASSLYGKLSFALCTVFGRGAVPGLRIISDIANGKRNGQLDDVSHEALGSVVHFLIHAKPRELSIFDNRKPVLIFTDASYEKEVAQYGIVAFIDDDRYVAQGIIPDSIVQQWKCLAGQQVISQAEIYPVIILKSFWSQRLKDRRVLLFIDNEAARFSLIKLNTPSVASIKLIHLYYNLEAESPSYTWFARVPSKSNPADWPSRGEAELAVQAFNATMIKIPEIAH